MLEVDGDADGYGEGELFLVSWMKASCRFLMVGTTGFEEESSSFEIDSETGFSLLWLEISL